jgi:hypothetical protein
VPSTPISPEPGDLIIESVQCILRTIGPTELPVAVRQVTMRSSAPAAWSPATGATNGATGGYAAALLKGYTGVLQTDGYSAYRSLAGPKRADGL